MVFYHGCVFFSEGINLKLFYLNTIKLILQHFCSSCFFWLLSWCCVLFLVLVSLVFVEYYILPLCLSNLATIMRQIQQVPIKHIQAHCKPLPASKSLLFLNFSGLHNQGLFTQFVKITLGPYSAINFWKGTTASWKSNLLWMSSLINAPAQYTQHKWI